MDKRFRVYDLNQPLLVPPCVQDWLPEDHLVRLVADVANDLDLSVTSCRAIEKATHDNVAFRYLAADQHPDHDTIDSFRQEHLETTGGLFVQALRLCPVIASGRRNRMRSFVNTRSEELLPQVIAERKGTLFCRDLNYLRDTALFWPFVLYSIFGVASAFSAGYRHFAIRCAAVAIVALILAKEKLLLFIVGVGFIAIQCAITLVLHSWNSAVFISGVLTGGTFFLAGHVWRRRKLTYKLPNKFRLVDALWSIASIIGSLALMYIVSPFK